VLFDRFGGIRDWSLPEVALFYGLISVTFAMADALGRGFDQFALMVRSGDFDRLLVRPRSTVVQLMGQELTIRRVGRLLQGTVVTYAIPLACVNYFPIVAVLDRPDPLGMPVAFQTVAPLAGVVFLAVALQVWTIGVRHYRSTGS
jgi:ABC-2 type transport system permease protein